MKDSEKARTFKNILLPASETIRKLRSPKHSNLFIRAQKDHFTRVSKLFRSLLFLYLNNAN